MDLEKRFLTVEELCQYTGWGKTKVRELLNSKNSSFTVRFGNRLYADKRRFDEYIDYCMRYHKEVH